MGQAGDDTFTVDGLSTVGLIDGGDNDDTLTVNNSGESITLGADVTAVETINATNGTLIAQDIANTWTVSGANSGTLANMTKGSIDFTGMANLTGGDDVDNFTFTVTEASAGVDASTGSISGLIDGGSLTSGTEVIDTVDINGLTEDQVVELGIDINENLNVHNIENIIANDLYVNTLLGDNVQNVWSVSSDSSSVTYSGITSNFTGFAHLTGGTEKDTFNLTAINDVTGLIDGGDGETDELVLSSDSQTVVLGSDITNIEIVTAATTSDNGFNILQGTDFINEWNVNAVQGSVVAFNDDGSENSKVTFFNFTDLIGGNNNDDFVISNISNVSGLIDGGNGGTDSLSINESGQSVTLGVDVDNIDSIIASGTGNTLTASDNLNIWTIDESGTDGSSLLAENIDNTFDKTSFEQFQVIVGGEGVDTFAITNADGIETISGGEGSDDFTVDADIGDTKLYGGIDTEGNDFDSIIYSYDNIIVRVGNDIDGFEKITASKNNGTIQGEDLVSNTWVIDDTNKGVLTAVQVDSSSEVMEFNGFNDIIGGDSSDTFNIVENGEISGSIFGGEGNDILNIELLNATRTQSSDIVFDGGLGDDVVNTSGDSNVYAETYEANVTVNDISYDSLAFVNEDGDNIVVNFTDVSSVNDDINTTSLTITNTTTDNDTYLSGTKFYTQQDSGFTEVSFKSEDKGDIYVVATDTQLLIDGDLSVDGTLTVSAENVQNNEFTSSIIIADNLVFDDVTNVGSEDNRINIDVNSLSADDLDGAIYLNESNDIVLTGLNNSSGVINISATNSITSESTTSLNSSAEIELNASNIDLSTSTNSFSGALTLEGDSVSIANTTATLLDEVVANNFTVESDGDITSSTSLIVSGTADISSKEGFVSLEGNNVIQNLIVNALESISLASLTGGSLDATSEEGDIVSEGVLSSINTDEDGVETAGTISLVANATNGSIQLTNIANDFSTVDIAANDAEITDANDIHIVSANLINDSIDGNTDVSDFNTFIVNANGDVSVGNITATDSINIDAGIGAIVNDLSGESQLTATEITLVATTGIGDGTYSDLVSESADNSGNINTTTSSLSAINFNTDTTSETSIINISNTGDVSVQDLRNNGDIVFSNDGDIILEESLTEDGAIDAHYLSDDSDSEYDGSVAILASTDNSISTTSNNILNADIIAENLLVNSVFAFGNNVNPISLRVNEEFTLFNVIGSVFYLGADPRNINTTGDLTELDLSSLSGQQLVEVESLGEVDPAIFSDVKNYNVDDISLLLPADQRIEEEENEEKEGESDLFVFTANE